MQIYRNEKNLGYIRNFEKSLSLCTGDIIFLSDQDDVWFESKVNNVVANFIARDDVFVVANDAEITGEKLERTGFTAVGQVISAGLPIESFFVGCCMAFRSEFKALALPIPHEIYSHDGWINVLANRLGCRHSIPDVLQFYRRHGNNASQSVTTSKRRAAGWRLLLERIRTRREIDPIAAYEIRYNQLTTLKSRLDSKGGQISKYLAPALSVADVNKTLEVELKGNSERRGFRTNILSQGRWLRPNFISEVVITNLKDGRVLFGILLDNWC